MCFKGRNTPIASIIITDTVHPNPPLRTVTGKVAAIQPSYLNVPSDLLSAVVHRLGVRLRETAFEPIRDSSRRRQDTKLDGQGTSPQ